MPWCERPDVRVHYEVSGDGPPLLLLNGLVASGFLWPRPWLDRFGEAYTVIRVSNRGTGHTPLTDGITIDALAADALAVLDECGAGRAHVLGFSMGGMIAQAVTLAQPERVAGLALCSTTTGGEADAHPEFLGALAATQGDAVSAFSSFIHLLTGPGFWDDNPEMVADLAAGWQQAPTPPETSFAQLVAVAAFDTRELAATIGSPVLILHGIEDRLIMPVGGERLAATIPGSRLEIFEGVGHMLPFEATERAGDLIEAFLAPIRV